MAKLEERIARAEGSLTALLAMHGMKADEIGNLRGERGERGARGLTGRKGRDGKDAPVWSGLAFDADTSSFVARMSDGSMGPLISLARLFASIEIDRATYSIILRTIDGTELRFSLRELFEQYDDEKRGVAPSSSP